MIESNDMERDLLNTLIQHRDQSKARAVVFKMNIDMFATTMTKNVYKSIRELMEENEVVDLTSVTGRLSTCETGFNNQQYMIELMTEASSIESYLITYAKRVRQSYYLRDAQKRVNEANLMIANLADLTKVGDLASGINELFSGLMLESHDQKPVLFREIAKDYIDDLQSKAAGNIDESITKTNIDNLDDLTGGFNDTDLIIIGGTPGSGKTEFAVDIIKGITGDGTSGALMFSLEMSNKQLVERSISGSANLPVSALRNPQSLTESGWGNLSVGLQKIVNNQFWMTDQVGLSVDDVVVIATRHIQDHPETKLIAVDYAGLLEIDNKKRHDLAMGDISRKLKLAAKDLGVPFVLLVQLNSKAIDSRPLADRMPRASDIKDSSRIEDDADLILLCYREKVYEESAPDIAEIVAAKARHAVKGAIYYSRFINGHFIQERQDLCKNIMDDYRDRSAQPQSKKKNF